MKERKRDIYLEKENRANKRHTGTHEALTHTEKEKRESKRENQKVMDSNVINAAGKTYSSLVFFSLYPNY